MRRKSGEVTNTVLASISTTTHPDLYPTPSRKSYFGTDISVCLFYSEGAENEKDLANGSAPQGGTAGPQEAYFQGGSSQPGQSIFEGSPSEFFQALAPHVIVWSMVFVATNLRENQGNS